MSGPSENSPLVDLLIGYLTERVLLVGVDGTILSSLGRSPGLLGFDEDERSGMHIAERVHPDDLPPVLELLARARRTAALEEAVVVRARHKDGSWRRLEVTVFSRSADPSLEAGVLRIRYVTERFSPVDVVADRSRFVSLAEALPVGVLSGDADDFLVFANDAAVASFGAGFEVLRGRGWLGRIRAEDRAEVEATLDVARTTLRTARATFATVETEGRAWLKMLVVPLARDGSYIGWVATLDDVTAERQLAYQATHDALTGLPNRWLVMDRLQQALAKCARHHDGVAVVFIDIDDLKAHNDACGHAAGDAVLVDVARRLATNVHPSDTAGRIGGDEFIVIFDVRNHQEALDETDRVRTLLACDVPHGRTRLAVTASVGVAFTDDPTMSPADLLAQADADMYHHKTRR